MATRKARRSGARPRAGRRIDVDLGEMKDELLAFCRRQNVSVSDALRQIVGRVLDTDVRRLPPIETGPSAENRYRSRYG